MKIQSLIALLLCLNISFLVAQTAQSPMGGVWYCSETKEIFAIETDDNNTIKGKGVWYAKGNQKFKFMQIMTQTATEKGYLLRCYDPAKPAMVFELNSMVFNNYVKIEMTKTGNRKKKFLLHNLNIGTPDTKNYKNLRPWEVIRRTLFDHAWHDNKRKDSSVAFKFADGYAQAQQDGHTERFAVNDNTFQITTFLQSYGKVKIELLFDEAWFLDVKNQDGETLTFFVLQQ